MQELNVLCLLIIEIKSINIKQNQQVTPNLVKTVGTTLCYMPHLLCTHKK